MLKKMLPLIFILIITTSCISKINIDGKPIPGHTYTQTNPRTGIRADFLFKRDILKTEGKEKFLYPAYLELNKNITIPHDTESIYILLQLVNIHEVSYTLVKKYTVWDGTPYPYKITQTVSISKQPNRIHEIRLPYKKGTKVDFGLQLFDKNGNFIMDIGQAKYTIEGGGAK